MKVFSGHPGYAGFYGPSTSGANVALTISRAHGSGDSSDALANDGFLADTYQIQWGRSVQVRRVFNKNQPIAVVGYGQGVITLSGLIGTYEGFENILGGAGNDTGNNQDLCNPLVIEIDGSGAYNKCIAGDVSGDTQGGVGFKLTGCLVQSIQVTGQIETNSGTLLQQANVVFSIGGFEIDKASDGASSSND